MFPTQRQLIVVVFVGLCLSGGVTSAQKIGKSVGENGQNEKADVKLIQALLNETPGPSGGPAKKLDVDGLIGPKTIAAIKKFQRTQLGFQDGRVDSGGKTEFRLLEFQNFKNQDRSGQKIAWGLKVTGPFKAKVLNVAKNVSIDPDSLMAAMAFESAESFSPAIKNAAGSGATGLIQFMPKSANGLGTTTEKLANMTAVEQLDYVEKYFTPYKGKCKTLSDLYMAILWPSAIGKAESHVLFDKNKQPTAYKQNKGLDADNDGKITKKEASAKVDAKLTKGNGDGFKG